jgi:7-cyano-7-deazaguanine synthase
MSTRSKEAVALLSSGLDSSIAMALAIRDGWTISLALTFDYGQRAGRREAEHAGRIARHFGISHRVLPLPWFQYFQRGGGLLASSGEALPQPSVTDLSDAGFSNASAKAVWVPNRNGVLIEIAAGFAEDSGADSVIVGFNKEEAATFPDNSLEYLAALNRALSFSTASAIEVMSPTAAMSKLEIVEAAKRIDFPTELLWSCYEAGSLMCGRCESCMRLKRALVGNGVMNNALFEDASLR